METQGVVKDRTKGSVLLPSPQSENSDTVYSVLGARFSNVYKESENEAVSTTESPMAMVAT